LVQSTFQASTVSAVKVSASAPSSGRSSVTSSSGADAYTLPHGEHGQQLYGDCPRDPHGNAVYTVKGASSAL
jgi:hypothetical protein